jgi:hypothetical protein
MVNLYRCELAAIRVICYMNSIVVSPLTFFLRFITETYLSVVEKKESCRNLSDRLCLGWWSGSCNMWLLGETEAMTMTKTLVAL